MDFMRVIALLAAYNEEKYMAQCLDHLLAQGVEAYLLDNESTDGTVAIAERHLGHGVVGIETISRARGYSLREMLGRREALAATLAADWFIHMDPDEFRLPPDPCVTLAEALAEVDAQGYNAVNFLEFVFIPTQESPDHDHPEFQKTMRWYYPFLPKYPHRLNAWKRQPGRVDLVSLGGHQVSFPGLAMYPVPFRMRHYHFLSVPHAIAKLVSRPYLQEELDRGWHTWRAKLRPEMIQLPSQDELKAYVSDPELDPSHPRPVQYLGEWVAAHEKSASPPSPAEDNQPAVVTKAASQTTGKFFALLGMSDPYPVFDHLRYPLDVTGGREHPMFESLIEAHRPELIVEVGSWKGKSAIHMATLLRERGLTATIVCVDTWLGTSTQMLSAAQPKWRIEQYRHHGYPTLYYQFLANVKYMGLQGYIVPFPNTSNIAARCLAYWQIQPDMIYIDGNHDEDDVYQDLVNYWSLLRPGGVLFGDDYWTAVGPGVINAVNRFAQEHQQPFDVIDSKWRMRKPQPERQASQARVQTGLAPVRQHDTQTPQERIAGLEAQVDSLHTQLTAAQNTCEAAAREVEAVRRAKAYRLATAYWIWSHQVRQALKSALGRYRPRQ
jgi:hypothetical protein